MEDHTAVTNQFFLLSLLAELVKVVMHKFVYMKPSLSSCFGEYSYLLFFVYGFLIVLCAAMRTEAVVELPPNVTVPGVIVFGDSIADQGSNNNLTTIMKCNFPPYGVDFTGGLATGRFTNAKTPPDLIGN